MNPPDIQGTLEDGQIPLSDDAKLPENATVQLVLPDASAPPARIARPRLANLADAPEFVKLVISEVADW